ncbi:inorganic diphosphatase [Desulfovibrio inopinatus]|uniref:inorganic diphosphatase n=1 Tax=Desulfovibrio inopinatus TaxID=102109 RepID=UPI0004089697|nr:inorganic diphosphatase [Desulfovibrio inopinatus]
MKNVIFAVSILACFFALPAWAMDVAPGVTIVDEYTIAGEKSFLDGYDPLNADGTINAVIEIPTGTNAKWEVVKPEGVMKWEFKKGKPRVVKFLGYPGNYGMIPKTILPKSEGGDGDPLDVLVLGEAVPRGSVVKAKLIGVLKLLDGGEQDDKLVAVLSDSPLASVNSIEEMKKQFPGVLDIVEIWFSSYKGPGEMESKGFAGKDEAMKVLKAAIAAYK